MEPHQDRSSGAVKITRMLKIKILLPFIILLASVSVSAGDWPLRIPKGTVVSVKIPLHFYEYSEIPSTAKKLSLFYIFITQDPAGRLIVNKNDNWRDAGWMAMTDFVLTDTNFITDKKMGFKGMEVILRNDTTDVRLWITPGALSESEAFDKLVYRGNIENFQTSDEYRKEFMDRFFPIYFPGPLASFSETDKLWLMKQSGYRFIDSFGLDEYKDKKYIFIANRSAKIFDSRRYNLKQRAASVINEPVLADMRNSYKRLKSYSGFDGLKMRVDIRYMNPATDSKPGKDFLEIYAPMDALKAFANDEITSQEFINKCVVLIDKNRTGVDLDIL
jgi:hypothetical protein